MPSAIPRKDVLSSTSWRNSKPLSHKRQASTIQESLHNGDDPRASAILHGKKEAKDHSQRPSNHDRSSKSTLSSHATNLGNNSTKAPQQHVLDRRKRNRDSEVLADTRPARRQRASALSTGELKDVAYIRRTMQVPTSKNYPNLKRQIFDNPKAYFHDALQGSASFEPDYTSIGRDLFRCTLSSNFSQSEVTEVTIGEGRSKVNTMK